MEPLAVPPCDAASAAERSSRPRTPACNELRSAGARRRHPDVGNRLSLFRQYQVSGPACRCGDAPASAGARLQHESPRGLELVESFGISVPGNNALSDATGSGVQRSRPPDSPQSVPATACRGWRRGTVQDTPPTRESHLGAALGEGTRKLGMHLGAARAGRNPDASNALRCGASRRTSRRKQCTSVRCWPTEPLTQAMRFGAALADGIWKRDVHFGAGRAASTTGRSHAFRTSSFPSGGVDEWFRALATSTFLGGRGSFEHYVSGASAPGC